MEIRGKNGEYYLKGGRTSGLYEVPQQVWQRAKIIADVGDAAFLVSFTSFIALWIVGATNKHSK